MDICLMIEGQEGVTWDQWVELARACDRLGFEGLFRSDHYLAFARSSERGALDAWATICGLAAVTDRIRLGAMVSPVTFRHPANLAKVVVTADHLSKGRVELGMGAGWFHEEHRAFGFPFPEPRVRMDMLAEQVEIVHGLWGGAGDVFSFEGDHYRLETCPALPRPHQDPHPPLILGGGAGPRSAALAARWADEYDVVYQDAPQTKQRMERISAACEAIGRDPDTVRRSLLTKTIVGSDENDVRRRVEELFVWENQDGDADEYFADLRRNHVVGTPEQVLDRLAEFAAAGIQRLLVHQLVHTDLESVELIGREVVPEAACLQA